MIRINLIQKKQASYAVSESGGASANSIIENALATLRSLKPGSGANNENLIQLVKSMGIPLVLSLVANFGYDYYIQTKTDVMVQELAGLDQEKEKINKELQKIKGFESVKGELERNELILRAKIDTIEKLIRGRELTVKSLVALDQAMPRDIWMTELKTSEAGYAIKGGTTDMALVGDFISRLGQTIYFKDVTLKGTTGDPNGRQAVFELSARRE